MADAESEGGAMRMSTSSKATVCAIPVAVMLLVSAFAHIENSYRFYDTVLSYKLVGSKLGLLIAGYLPFLQVTLGIALLFDHRGRRAAFVLSTLLFAGFVFFQTSAWYRNLDISCGCFGGNDESTIGWRSIGVANFGLILSMIGCWRSPRESRNEKQ